MPHRPSHSRLLALLLLGLLAAGHTDSPELRRGGEYLLREQKADGSWAESWWTGTGFPCVFYLRYHLYGLYFPLLALACFRKANEQQDAPMVERSA